MDIFSKKLKDIEALIKKENKIEITETFNCEKCKDKGIYLENNVAVPCACLKRSSLLKKYRNAKLSKEMLNCRFENFDFRYYSKAKDNNSNPSFLEEAKIAYDAAINFVKKILSGEDTKGLCFCGPVGSGKTFLALCIANKLLSKDKEVLFTVVPDLLEELRLEYFKNNEFLPEQTLNELTKNIPILILDDLGVHNYTEWTLNKLYTIINYRANNNLPIIITTNLEVHQMAENLGERITSRIIQLCQTYHISTDVDIRIQKYSKYNKKTN